VAIQGSVNAPELAQRAFVQTQANRYYYLKQIANKLLIQKIVRTK
jgi:hypothetical protein